MFVVIPITPQMATKIKTGENKPPPFEATLNIGIKG
jgi:hypothetical protein